MRTTSAYFIFVLLIMMPAMVHAYPLENTEFLRAAYCFHMSNAPRLEVDLSDTEKEQGQRRFFMALISRDLEFPQNEDYEKIQNKFIAWVVPRFRDESTDAALNWYRDNCVSSSE